MVALRADGSVRCWGLNTSGQCDVPPGVGFRDNPVVQISAGAEHTIALLEDGTTVSWGGEAAGESQRQVSRFRQVDAFGETTVGVLFELPQRTAEAGSGEAGEPIDPRWTS